MFVGRKKELNKLLEIFEMDEFKGIVISGRRRIGKSSLISEFLKKVDCLKIYFECNSVSMESNCKGLAFAYNLQNNLPLDTKYESFEEILELIFKKSETEKVVLVLDEFQYLTRLLKGYDSILQNIIDKYYNSSKMKLIISGSYVNAIEKLLEYDSPLYGRFKYCFILKDLTYLESSEFYSNYSLEDKVKAYAVFGCNPFYLSFLNNKLSVEENIKKVILANINIFINPLGIYFNEIRNVENAQAIFSLIGGGKHKYTDLTTDTITSSNLSNVLSILLKMGLIEKISPINDQNNKKKTFYYIQDNFLDFFFRYIYEKAGNLQVLDENEFYKKIIKKDFEEIYVPKKFEKLCKEALIQMNLKQKMNPSFLSIGKYWYDNPKEKVNAEFDIVYEDLNDIYNFIEVKFSKYPIDNKTVEWLNEQVKKTKIKNYKLGFISKSGFVIDNPDNYLLLELKDLYFE